MLIVLCATGTGCAGGYALAQRETPDLRAAAVSEHAIAWFSPVVQDDRRELNRWRAGVGPEVINTQRSLRETATDQIIFVSWNVAVGAGDVERMVASLPRTSPIVLLLQEVYRGGPEVPAHPAKDAQFAARHGGSRGGAHFKEIGAIADALDLAVYYVPSMRNGPPSASDEDRGNAILTDLPLSKLAAIELPFERQRRVAVAATISGRTAAGKPWQLRVISAHLDNRAGVKRLFVASEYGRVRQARALVDLFRAGPPTLLAGDFNTWFGFWDRAYTETARAFPQTHVTDKRATFLGVMRLDHVFVNLAPGWRAEFRRSNDRFGSDHSPLIGTVRFDR